MLVRPRLIGPLVSGRWKATPGTQIRSNHPLRIADIPYHHVGKHSTRRLGGAKALDVILDPGEIIARLHIDRVLRQAEHGIKVRPIEVQFVNLMSLRSEAREYAVMDGRCETG